MIEPSKLERWRGAVGPDRRRCAGHARPLVLQRGHRPQPNDFKNMNRRKRRKDLSPLSLFPPVQNACRKTRNRQPVVPRGGAAAGFRCRPPLSGHRATFIPVRSCRWAAREAADAVLRKAKWSAASFCTANRVLSCQVPTMIEVLAGGFDAGMHRKLIRSNWLRTLAWTGRGVLVLAPNGKPPA